MGGKAHFRHTCILSFCMMIFFFLWWILNLPGNLAGITTKTWWISYQFAKQAFGAYEVQSTNKADFFGMVQRIVSTHCRSDVRNIESHFVFVQDSFLVWGIEIIPSLFLGSNVNHYVLISWWKCKTRTKWEILLGQVVEISEEKLRMQFHQFQWQLQNFIKNISDKSSALVQFLRANYLFGSFAS